MRINILCFICFIFTLCTPFDGFTRQTFATLEIDPTVPHELVIAIGDANDAKVSSQVFVMAHSLSTLRVGCVDPDASNYDPTAQIDDEPTACVYKATVVWLDCDIWIARVVEC